MTRNILNIALHQKSSYSKNMYNCYILYYLYRIIIYLPTSYIAHTRVKQMEKPIVDHIS